MVTAQWLWKSDSAWVPYADDMQRQLEATFEDGGGKVAVDGSRYVSTKEMLQKRYDNKGQRKVKRVVTEGKDTEKASSTDNSKGSSSSSSSSSSSKNKNKSKSNKANSHSDKKPVYSSSDEEVLDDEDESCATTNKAQHRHTSITWKWMDNDRWEQYNYEVSLALEEAWQVTQAIGKRKGKQDPVPVKVSHSHYVDVVALFQHRYDDPKRVRNVSREVVGAGFGLTQPHAPVQWYWHGDVKQGWVKYDEGTSKRIEAAYLSNEDKIKVDDTRFIQFGEMLQMRFDDKSRARYVKRTGQPKETEQSQTQEPESDDGNDEDVPAKRRRKEEASKDTAPPPLSRSMSLNTLNTRIEKERMARRRSKYKCDSYTTMDDVPTWHKWFTEHLDDYKRMMPDSLSEREAGVVASKTINKKVSLWKGDITAIEVEAIVNAAKPSLLGGGGIDGAIHKAAGRGLVKECYKLDGCEVGEAKISTGHRLPADFIIHTVGPIGKKPAKLRSCYNSCLAVALQYSLRTVVFNCISTGIYGYPQRSAAKLALQTIRKWFDVPGNADKVDRIIFCVFLEEDLKYYRHYMPRFFPL